MVGGMKVLGFIPLFYEHIEASSSKGRRPPHSIFVLSHWK